MRSFDEVKNGDVVRSIEDNTHCKVIEYNGNKYLSGYRDMWNVNEFNPKD